MTIKRLTSDKTQLSRSKITGIGYENATANFTPTSHLQSIALDGAGETTMAELPNPALSHEVQGYLSQSLSEATKRAYKSDMDAYETFGGTVPSTDGQIAHYIAELAETHAVATIVRRLAAIGKAHRSRGLADPTKSELVKATLRGIRRAHGTAQLQAKPLLKEDLFAVLEGMGDRPKDLRDKALLLIGFAGGFRRSELVDLNLVDIEYVRQGMIITLRRSKTDQEGLGRRIGIPFGRTRWCPVHALERWLEAAEIDSGAIFRGLDRNSRLQAKRLSGEAVGIILKERLLRAGVDPDQYSGHSLRAGFATSAAMAGASTMKIRAQTGHTSDAMLARYIREGDLFANNAAGTVL